MAVSIVQQASVAVASPGAGFPVTLPAAPSAGNLLLIIGTFQTPLAPQGGFSVARAGAPTGGDRINPFVVFKVAGPSEPASQVPFSGSDAFATMTLYEVAGVAFPSQPSGWLRDVQWRTNTGFTTPWNGSPLVSDADDALALVHYALRPYTGGAPNLGPGWTTDSPGVSAAEINRRWSAGHAALSDGGSITPSIASTTATEVGYAGVVIADVEPLPTLAQLTQGVSLLGTGQGIGMGRISQAVALILQAPVVPSRLTQAVALVSEPGIRPARITQAPALVLASSSSCITTRAQIWTITRRDGVVLTFTSHDRPIVRFGRTYTPCRSLNPSASENASSLGAVGNMELTGIIDDESISEEDLYGGKFDDAFVEVDLVDWTEPTGAAMRIASGWTGEMTQGAVSFNMEVLGGSARLNQQALVQMIAPSCRWVFGDPATCKKDREALKMTGAVLSAQTRGAFTATISGDGAGRQWENGTVRWTSGRNTGQSCEIKSLDIPGGGVVLWSAASYGPEAGDTFDLLPGCDLAKTGGCTLYANVINFGGFSDVPGQDSLLETPEAKY